MFRVQRAFRSSLVSENPVLSRRSRQKTGLVQELMPGRFDPCQLAWQVNQLSRQEWAQKETVAGPREPWPTGLFSRFASLWAGCVGCALADKLLAPARRAGRGPGISI